MHSDMLIVLLVKSMTYPRHLCVNTYASGPPFCAKHTHKERWVERVPERWKALGRTSFKGLRGSGG